MLRIRLSFFLICIGFRCAGLRCFRLGSAIRIYRIPPCIIVSAGTSIIIEAGRCIIGNASICIIVASISGSIGSWLSFFYISIGSRLGFFYISIGSRLGFFYISIGSWLRSSTT